MLNLLRETKGRCWPYARRYAEDLHTGVITPVTRLAIHPGEEHYFGFHRHADPAIDVYLTGEQKQFVEELIERANQYNTRIEVHAWASYERGAHRALRISADQKHVERTFDEVREVIAVVVPDEWKEQDELNADQYDQAMKREAWEVITPGFMYGTSWFGGPRPSPVKAPEGWTVRTVWTESQSVRQV